MANISLAMIVRDEEELLPACLESAAHIVDEIVVADTGSTDGTIEVALAHHAHVVHRPWDDDFAAARNAALAHVTGDFVLVLDADERLGPGAGQAIERAIRFRDWHVGLCRLNCASRKDADIAEVLSGAARLDGVPLLPRLLRRTDDLAYRGIIHESLEHWIAAHGFRIRDVDVDLVHLGSCEEMRRERKKAARNFTLLTRRCELEPDNVEPAGYLATELLQRGRFAEARAVIARGWGMLGSQPAYRSPVRLVVAKAWLELQDGDPRAALATISVVSDTRWATSTRLGLLRDQAAEAWQQAYGRGDG